MLKAMAIDKKTARSTIRISFGRASDDQAVEKLLAALKAVLHETA